MLESRFACGLFAVLCFSLAHVETNAQGPIGLCGTSWHAIQPTESFLAGRQVELFQAIADGQIDVELIAPSAREVWLRVTNKTNDLLKIDLPAQFAAVPVLGQMAPMGNMNFGFPGGGMQNNFGAGQNFGNAQGGFGQAGQGMGGQGLGGGFNNGGIGNGNFGNFGGGNMFGNGMRNPLGNGLPMRGMFRVPPGRTGKVRAETVCLEHGKPEPNSRMRYRIVPIEQFHSDARIAQLCQMLARRQITQNVAQAAAWHIANGLSWEELAAKDRAQSKYAGNQKFFTASELQQAMRVVELSNEAASENTETSTPATTASLSVQQIRR